MGQGYIEVIVETQMEKKMDMSWKLDFTPVFSGLQCRDAEVITSIIVVDSL